MFESGMCKMCWDQVAKKVDEILLHSALHGESCRLDRKGEEGGGERRQAAGVKLGNVRKGNVLGGSGFTKARGRNTIFHCLCLAWLAVLQVQFFFLTYGRVGRGDTRKKKRKEEGTWN